jgi:hypothetical protein
LKIRFTENTHFIFFKIQTKALEIHEKTAKIAVNRKPKAVIKGYKMANITVQIFDFVCMKMCKNGLTIVD